MAGASFGVSRLYFLVPILFDFCSEGCATPERKWLVKN
jgi:hypothetical protein